jgi:hypothetical protein
MTTPNGDAPATHDRRCQTDGCLNDFAVIIVRVDDSSVLMLCEGCNLAFNLAVLQQASQQGLIVLPGQEPAPAGAAQQ